VINPISDTTTAALAVALDGLDRRQQAIASNLANLETPGYLSREVEFESSLRAALLDGRPEDAAITVDRSLAPTRLNGNNVNVDIEMVKATETQLRQRLAVEGLNAKYRLMRTAITGR
jgi:flagellar basal-body rod protein FlgB